MGISRRIFRRDIVLVLAALTLAVLGVGRGLPPGEADSGPSVERARALAAEARNLASADLRVVRMRPFAESGIMQFKLMDVDGHIVGIDLDASGHPVDSADKERHRRRQERRGFVGKLEAALHDEISRHPHRHVRFVCLLENHLDARLAAELPLDHVRPRRAAAGGSPRGGELPDGGGEDRHVPVAVRLQMMAGRRAFTARSSGRPDARGRPSLRRGGAAPAPAPPWRRAAGAGRGRDRARAP